MSFTIQHPKFGMQVLITNGETVAQGVDRYNKTVLGWDPDSAQYPDVYPIVVSSPPLYTKDQISDFITKGVGGVRDPHTQIPITPEDYLAKYGSLMV